MGVHALQGIDVAQLNCVVIFCVLLHITPPNLSLFFIHPPDADVSPTQHGGLEVLCSSQSCYVVVWTRALWIYLLQTRARDGGKVLYFSLSLRHHVCLSKTVLDSSICSWLWCLSVRPVALPWLYRLPLRALASAFFSTLAQIRLFTRFFFSLSGCA